MTNPSSSGPIEIAAFVLAVPAVAWGIVTAYRLPLETWTNKSPGSLRRRSILVVLLTGFLTLLAVLTGFKWLLLLSIPGFAYFGGMLSRGQSRAFNRWLSTASLEKRTKQESRTDNE